MADNQPPHTSDKTAAQTPKAAAAARKQARLSQALKANMARRKGQARARSAENVSDSAGGTTGTAQNAADKEN